MKRFISCLVAISITLFAAVSVIAQVSSNGKSEQTGNIIGSSVSYGVNGNTPVRQKVDQYGGTVIGEESASWATARTNVAANDTATTYGTADTGNFSVSGYKHVRFRVFMNATADSMAFACGTATPTTNPYYGYTPTVTVSGYSTTAPFTCSCDTNGQTVMFPRVTGLSSGGNVTAIKYQAYN